MDDAQGAAVAGTTSRYLAISRRAALSALALGAYGALAACSDGDEEALAAGPASAGDAAPGAGSGAAAGADAFRPEAGDAVPDSAAMTIRFTFAAGDGGRGPARNPYIAVWIETPAEELVTTVALWHLQQNERWLGELKRWYAFGDQKGESVSGATRVPGQYTLQWDCAVDGAKVGAGEYYVCIEAAREHGPYELIREPMTLGAAPAEATFPPDGELTAASAAYTV